MPLIIHHPYETRIPQWAHWRAWPAKAEVIRRGDVGGAEPEAI